MSLLCAPSGYKQHRIVAISVCLWKCAKFTVMQFFSFFRMWRIVVCPNPVSKANSWTVWRWSISSNLETACASLLTRGRLGHILTFPHWRLLPTLLLFCKAVQIPCKPLEDLHDTVKPYGFWCIQSLSNSAVLVLNTSWQHYIRPTANTILCLVTVQVHKIGRGSPWALRWGRYVTNMWYKWQYLFPFHGTSTARLPALVFPYIL